MTETIEIPVIADSLARAPELGLARCVYFSITSEEPAPGWTMGLDTRRIPFLMLGLQGIIIQPSTDQSTFNSADDIDSLIDAIESLQTPVPEQFDVVTEFIWLPTDMLDTARADAGMSEKGSTIEAERGDVFRVAYKFFQHAWQFLDGGMAEEELLSWRQLVLREHIPLWYSQEETRAFSEWSERHLRGQRGSAQIP